MYIIIPFPSCLQSGKCFVDHNDWGYVDSCYTKGMWADPDNAHRYHQCFSDELYGCQWHECLMDCPLVPLGDTGEMVQWVFDNGRCTWPSGSSAQVLPGDTAALGRRKPK